jgi:hypothetical protein
LSWDFIDSFATRPPSACAKCKQRVGVAALQDQGVAPKIGLIKGSVSADGAEVADAAAVAAEGVG